MTEDFATLPPEVNSGRMYTGAGSAPMTAAATAWERLAAGLSTTASSYRAVLNDLVDDAWQGSAATAMRAAAQPYLTWLTQTAARAAQTAGQARTTAAAYEAAFAATVPPAVVAANRSALNSLVTTNVLGQNTAAIAANQGDYAAMWAQDVAAMQTYAAQAAAVAPNPSSLSAPPQTTGSAAETTQASSPSGLVAMLNNPDNPILAFLNSDPVQAFETIFPILDPFWSVAGTQIPATAALWEIAAGAPVVAAISAAQTFAGATGAVPAFAAASISGDAEKFTLASAPAPLGVGRGGVTAGLGRAMQLGALSAPASWRAVVGAEVSLAAAASPLGSVSNGVSAPFLGGIPPVGGMVNASSTVSPAVRYGRTVTVIPRLARAGCGTDLHVQSVSSPADGSADVGVLGDYEQRELEELREAMADLTARRDAAARSIREAIRYEK